MGTFIQNLLLPFRLHGIDLCSSFLVLFGYQSAWDCVVPIGSDWPPENLFCDSSSMKLLADLLLDMGLSLKGYNPGPRITPLTARARPCSLAR